MMHDGFANAVHSDKAALSFVSSLSSFPIASNSQKLMHSFTTSVVRTIHFGHYLHDLSTASLMPAKSILSMTV